VALDVDFIKETDFHEIYALTSQAEAQISGLINYLATSDKRGPRLRSQS
jgi:hypothetical protein